MATQGVKGRSTVIFSRRCKASPAMQGGGSALRQCFAGEGRVGESYSCLMGEDSDINLNEGSRETVILVLYRDL